MKRHRNLMPKCGKMAAKFTASDAADCTPTVVFCSITGSITDGVGRAGGAQPRSVTQNEFAVSARNP